MKEYSYKPREYLLIGNLDFYDNLVILIYFAVVFLIGIISARGKGKSAKSYFLADKKMGWIAIGTSLFATNISSEHLVGLAGASSAHGFSVGHFEWLAVLSLFMLGWVFAPVFIRADVYTIPEFLGKRFNKKCRTYLSVVSIFSYLFTKIAVTLLAGSYLLNKLLGWDMFIAAILIVLLTGIYTLVGGLSSVIRTQVFQAFVLILGSLLLTIYGLNEVGGISALITKLPPGYLTIFKPFSDPDFPWTGILLGAPILGIWYWCTDQYIVQRILGAKGIKDAKKGTALAAGLKTIPILLLIFPGLISAVLYPEVKGDEAYTYLIAGNLLPIGIKGIVIAGMFAALMSSLASAFNSTATLIAIDFVKANKPNISENELILIGRLSTMLIVIIAIGIIPALKMVNTQMYVYLQSMQAFISPPIASVFLIGIFWKKATSKGAIWSLTIGGILGLTRIIIALLDKSFVEGSWLLNIYANVNYLHFAVLLFLFSTFILVVVSLADQKSNLFEYNLSIMDVKDKELGLITPSSKLKRE